MAFINAETKVPELLLGYIESQRVALELPAAEVLPFVLALAAGEVCRAEVRFGCERVVYPHPKITQCTVNVDLKVPTEVDDAPGMVLEGEWVAAVRHALQDGATFWQYLMSLPVAERGGWVITKYRVIEGAIEVDPQKHTRSRRTQVQVHFRSNEGA